MTLFITTPKRTLEIDDIYVMALSFLIFFAVGKVVKAVIKKLEQKNTKNVNVANPRGGEFSVTFTDDNELAQTILSCIADNERYLVKDQDLINIVFNLAKAKITNESLVLTPNLLRFVALQLLNDNQGFIAKFGNMVASSNNRIRLYTRVMGVSVIAFVGALFSVLPYAILMGYIYLDSTEHCGYRCSDYFEQLPKEGPVQVFGKEPTGHLVIGGNDDARQVEIYNPSPTEGDELVPIGNGKIRTTRTYKKTRQKAKQVKFSEFKETDPILSQFKNIEEPEIPQQTCMVNDLHNLLDVEVLE